MDQSWYADPTANRIIMNTTLSSWWPCERFWGLLQFIWLVFWVSVMLTSTTSTVLISLSHLAGRWFLPLAIPTQLYCQCPVESLLLWWYPSNCSTVDSIPDKDVEDHTLVAMSWGAEATGAISHHVRSCLQPCCWHLKIHQVMVTMAKRETK